MRPVFAARRALEHLQKGSQRQLSSGPGQSKSVKDFDEEKYGGWKSAKMLFADEPERKSLIGRADWHVVQFLLAMIPSGAVLLMVQWARYDMKRMEARLEKEALAKESAKLVAVTKHQQEEAAKAQAALGGGNAAAASVASAQSGGAEPGAPAAATGPQAGPAALEERITQLEALVRQLQAQQAAEQGPAAQQQGQRQHPPGARAAAAAATKLQPQQQQQQQDQAPATLPQQPQQEEQPAAATAAPTLVQRLRAAGRWVASAAASAAAQVPSLAAGGLKGGTDSTKPSSSRAESSSSSKASPSSASSGAAGVQPEGISSSPAAGQPASQPGRGEQQACAPAAYGNTANRLLHAVGQPLRWLRHLGERSPPRPGGD